MIIEVTSGNDVLKHSDALLTTTITDGLPPGNKIDEFIRQTAGNQFHEKLFMAGPSNDGQVVVVKGDDFEKGVAFSNVIFVADKLRQPLNVIISAGLEAAADAGFSSVILPVGIRMDSLIGMVEASEEEVLKEMVEAVYDCDRDEIERITIVVDNNTESQLRQILDLD